MWDVDIDHMDNQVVEGLGCNRTASRCSGSPLKSDKNKSKILVVIKAVLHDFPFQWYKKPPASISISVYLQPEKRT